MAKQDFFVAFGPRVYRIVRPWGKPPKSIKYGTISKCAVDRHGNLHVAQRADPPIIVYDPKGKFVRVMGKGKVADAHGIIVDKDDRVLVVDRDGHQVLGFDAKGKLVLEIGKRDRPRFQAPFSHPTDVAVGPKGDIYVSDGYGNTNVHRFAPDGTHKKTWGGPGSGPGQFTTPHGIRVLADGRVLVGDRENDRIQVFDPDGAYLAQWTGFYHPMDIHVGIQGLVYVSDQAPSVHARTTDGVAVGRNKCAISMPHGVGGDAEGNLYIVDTRVPIITRLEPVN